MSPASKRALRSFLTDALRMSAQAAESVRELSEQARQQAVPAGKVKTLYQIVHTLKGTATMVYGGESVVESLQALESRLATRPAAESARDLDWLELAETSLKQAREALLELEKKERSGSPMVFDEPNGRGLLARVALDSRRSALLWFPFRSLARVFSQSQLKGRQVVSLDGAYVPVLGVSGPIDSEQSPRFGLGVKLDAGKIVVAVQEFGGLMTWSEAVKKGAVAGLDFVSAQMANNRTDKGFQSAA